MATGQLMPGMSSAADLQAAGDYDNTTPTGMPGEGGSPDIVVCIALSVDGTIRVYDEGGKVEPQPAEGMDDALQSAKELLTELAKLGAQEAMQTEQMARPGNQDAQAIWDEMAAQRPPRGNT